MPLPPTPKVELEVAERHAIGVEGFLTLTRCELVLVIEEQGHRSPPFRYDIIERRALDAAVIVAHHVAADGRVHVYLRSSIRPPVLLRAIEPQDRDALWEVPAGLVEPGESPHAAAMRELEEELGFSVAPETMLALGGRTYPAPGFIGEMHCFFHVQVDPTTRKQPSGDGSALEAASTIVSIPLEEAMALCRIGQIRDAKTELALRRLVETFP